MDSEHEEFISAEDDELKHIRERKLHKLLKRVQEKKSLSTQVVHLTDSNFDDVISKNKLVLVDFYADWCMPCRMMAPVIEELAKEFAGKVLVGKINVDENPKTADRFQVFSIPTIVIIESGREVDRIIGFVPKSRVEASLKKYLE
ncbi:MAG: thioredoxin [Candidatus Bathyarchaeia archaeon]